MSSLSCNALGAHAASFSNSLWRRTPTNTNNLGRGNRGGLVKLGPSTLTCHQLCGFSWQPSHRQGQVVQKGSLRREHVRGPQAGMGHNAEPSFVSLCASHINTLKRWKAFKQMLDSWRMQTHTMPMIVSMTIRPDLVDHCKLPAMQGLTILRQEGRLSQFQHYKHLSALDLPPETWVLFTDDDDLWHPTRAETYFPSLVQVERAGAQLAYVNCSAMVHSGPYLLYLRPGEQLNIFHPSSAADVDALINADKVIVSEPDMSSYLDYCVQLSTLRHFVERCDSRLLSHKFCDMAFARYMREHTLPKELLQSSTWLYYYRYDPSVGQVTVGDSEWNSKLQLIRSHVELQQATFGSCNIEEIYLKDWEPLPAKYRPWARMYISETEHLAQLPLFRM